ncbi:DUF4062 domain-containing protein [Pantoea ananatis]|uniref:DUF4062 domain-containing protein n=1 Tax=Pantoea ananas TaxID=553 RepID=UPI000497C4D8|nr:DUF4062 domain-containing protein [Pantoea ananatis]
MDKRYQVFVSSTFTDLEQERSAVIQTLMEMDCIPAGMELFPAIDEEQWEFIKKVIDDCDYYLLIIGGRYGTIAGDGLSYTEKEFDYAVSKGLKVVVLVHENPETLPLAKSERNEEARNKLLKFIDKASTGRLRKPWSTVKDIPGLVSLSMSKTIKTYPAIGWVRADRISNENSLIEINNLRRENSELMARNSKLEQEIKLNETNRSDIEELASFDSDFNFTFTGYLAAYNSRKEKRSYPASLTWKEIFFHISPLLVTHKNESTVNSAIAECANEKAGKNVSSLRVKEQDFFTIGIQLKSYGLIKIEHLKTVQGSMALFWSLTTKGWKLMEQLRTIKS